MNHINGTPTSGVAQIPSDGDWPCERLPVMAPGRLVAALYLLARDHVAPGTLEQVMINVRRSDRQTHFTNIHLKRLAQAHAAYLLEDDS